MFFNHFYAILIRFLSHFKFSSSTSYPSVLFYFISDYWTFGDCNPSAVWLMISGSLTNVIKRCSVSALVLTHESVLVQVSVRIKKVEDGAVWIRIAWGDNFTKPNHLKPTYAVHYLQTPYVFILNLNAKHKPFLYQVTFFHVFLSRLSRCTFTLSLWLFCWSHSQALVLSTRHVSVNEAHLSGRSLTALRDLLMKQYQQVKHWIHDPQEVYYSISQKLFQTWN